MKIEGGEYSAATVDADAVVVGIGDDRKMAGPVAEVNQASDGLLNRLLEREEIVTTKFSVTQIFAPHGLNAGQLVVVGLGSDQQATDAGLAFARRVRRQSNCRANAERRWHSFWTSIPRGQASPAASLRRWAKIVIGRRRNFTRRIEFFGTRPHPKTWCADSKSVWALLARRT